MDKMIYTVMSGLQLLDIALLQHRVAVDHGVHIVSRYRLAIVPRLYRRAEQQGHQTQDAGDGKAQAQQLIEQFFADEMAEHQVIS